MGYRFGDYELDRGAFELRCGDEVIHIEPQVMEVLTYLIEHRDRVVPKEELLDNIWGDRFVSESALTSRVKAARKAVGDNGQLQAVIKTVHGRGYRFVAPIDDDDRAEVAREPGSPRGRAERAWLGSSPPGREKELGELRALLGEALSGRRTLAVVSGPAGIGKTTLVESFLAGIPASEAIVAAGSCVPQRGSGESYLPVLDALGQIGSSPAAGDLADVLAARAPLWLLQLPWLASPEQIESADRRAAGAGPERMLREVLESLDALAERHPLVIVLEDLHWGDPSTLDLLDALARRRGQARLLLLATMRPEENPTGLAAPDLAARVQSLAARGLCHHVPLERLDRVTVGKILGDRLGVAEPPEGLLSAVYDRTGGLPLFLRELLELWIAEGLVRTEGGDLVLIEGVDSLAGRIPPNVRGMVAEMVDRLPGRQVELLEAASVIGPRFSAALLGAAVGTDTVTVESELDSLLHRASVVHRDGEEAWPDGTVSSAYSFSHELIRDVVRERLPAGRRALMDRAVGERLERAAGDSDERVVSRLAAHFVGANDAERAVRYSALAAEHQLRRSAYREAMEHLNRARSMIPGLPPGSERDMRELDLLITAGNASIAAYGYAAPETVTIYEEARTVCDRLGEGPHFLPVLYGLWNNTLVAGGYTTGLELADTFLSMAAGSAAATLVAHRSAAWPLLLMGRYGEAREHLEQIAATDPSTIEVDEWAPFGEHPVVAGQGALAWLLWLGGDSDGARDLADRALDVARRLEHPLTLAYAHAAETALAQYERDAPRTLRAAEASMANADAHQLVLFGGWARIERGWAVAQEGDLEEGLAEIEAGLAEASEARAAVFGTYFQCLHAEVLMQAGKLDSAVGVIEDALDAATRTVERYFEPELHRLRAHVLSSLGEPSAAENEAKIALSTAQEMHAVPLHLRAAMTAAELAAQTGDTEGARNHLREAVEAALGSSSKELSDAREALERLGG